MKVVYSLGSHFATTGISNTAYQAVSEINKQSLLKRLICLDFKETEISREKIKSFWPLKYLVWFPLKGVQRYILPNFNPYIFLDKFYDALACKRIEKSDIFHYWRGHGITSSRKAKAMGAKIFVENASSHPEIQNKILVEEYAKYGLKIQPYSKKRLEEASQELDRADYIVVPKGFAYDSFIKKGFSEKKLVGVNFGIDLKKFENFKKDKKDKKFRAIYVGQVTLRKGIQYVLEAWQELDLKDAELVIVGQSAPDASKLIKQYKNIRTVKFVGQTNPLPHYSNSDIFVFPSLEEGSALVTYEAMACGLPQISTYNSGTVARNGKEGFIIPIRDVEKIKEKIKYFYNNPKRTKEMSKNCLEEIKKYSWENYGKKIIRDYKKSLFKE